MIFYELRYVIMRFVRLVLSLVAEAATLASCLPLVIGGVFFPMALVELMFSKNHQSEDINMITLKYGAMLLVGIIGLVGGAALYIAMSIPYRYKTDMPGVDLVNCKNCSHRIPNVYHCPECGRFRMEKAGFSVIWLLSLFVTILWCIHDCIATVLCLSGGKK